MQAIQTRFLAPTNTRDPRVKAWCNAGSVTVEWDDERHIEANHAEAARALAIKLGWTKKHYGGMVGGALPGDNGYCFVFLGKDENPDLYCFAPDEVTR